MMRSRVAWPLAALGCVASLGLSRPPAVAAQGRFAAHSARALIQEFRHTPPQEIGEVTAEIFTRRAEASAELRSMLASGGVDDRRAACQMLGQLRDRDAVGALLTATNDGDREVRARAISALRTIGDVRAAVRLRQIVRGNPTDLGILRRAIVGLGKLGAARDLTLLRPYLAHSDESVRVIAAGAMARLGNSEGEDILLAASHHGDPAVQKEAIGLLGYVGSSTARQRIDAIVADPNGSWRSYALIAQSLQHRSEQDSAEQAAALETLARSGDRIIAPWAMEELVDSPAPEATEAIRRLSARRSRVARDAQLRLRLKEAR